MGKMISFEVKRRLSQGGIYDLNIISASKETSDKGTSIKVVLGNDEIEHPFYIPVIDDTVSEGKQKAFKTQMTELVLALCTIEQKKKKNPLDAESYDHLASNIVDLINNNIGMTIKIKIVVNTYNNKLSLPAFGDWISTVNNTKPLKKGPKETFILADEVTPSDDLSGLSSNPTSELSSIAKADAPF